MNLGKFTDALKAGKTPEEAIAGACLLYTSRCV